MIFQYPKVIKNLQTEKPFRYAVLHGLCYRDRKAGKSHNPENHAYLVGYWIGMMVTRYIASYRIHPLDDNVDIKQMVVDEVNRLDKENERE